MKAITSSEAVESKVRALLSQHGRIGATALSMPIDASLAEAGLSSLATIDLMLALEAEYGEFPERMLTARVFRSIETITAALCEWQNA